MPQQNPTPMTPRTRLLAALDLLATHRIKLAREYLPSKDRIRIAVRDFTAPRPLLTLDEMPLVVGRVGHGKTDLTALMNAARHSPPMPAVRDDEVVIGQELDAQPVRWNIRRSFR
ncbi:hypothetical protein [Streptomyces nanshensis]|uniref:Uncharacterized protein n=1 Tax=Streptomyces nanshensis TaxID=518642 RepID=A0A1E7L280_9ACTN|nr:hypothetical protein [Streptomyces nanshensis]OEV10221.1 hypothetical protein AN218_18555 [Streptomyces nanshensis]